MNFYWLFISIGLGYTTWRMVGEGTQYDRPVLHLSVKTIAAVFSLFSLFGSHNSPLVSFAMRLTEAKHSWVQQSLFFALALLVCCHYSWWNRMANLSKFSGHYSDRRVQTAADSHTAAVAQRISVFLERLSPENLSSMVMQRVLGRHEASGTLLSAVMANTAGQWRALIGCYGQHRRRSRRIYSNCFHWFAAKRGHVVARARAGTRAGAKAKAGSRPFLTRQSARLARFAG